MEYHEVVSHIRKSKNITIDETIGKKFSRSSYYRYINGTSDLYSQSFLDILKNLNVSLSEIEFISNQYAEPEDKIIMKRIKISFERKDLNELNFLQEKADNLFKSNSNIVYKHLESLIYILTHRLSKKDIDIQKTTLFNYLIKTETWSRYELVLFNNSLFYFNKQSVEQILPRAINKLSLYHKINPYANEAIRLITNAVIFFLKEYDTNQAIKYINVAENFSLTEEQLYEKLLVKLLSSIKKILTGDPEGHASINTYLDIMKELDMKNLEQMTNSLIQNLK